MLNDRYFECNAYSDQQLIELKLVAKGTYEAEVFSETRKTSQYGNAYMNVALKVYENGKDKMLYDIFMSKDTEANARHIKQYAYALGLKKEYDAAVENKSKYMHELGKNNLGKRVKIDVDIREDKETKRLQNIIKSYASIYPENSDNKSNDFDDNIPY